MADNFYSRYSGIGGGSSNVVTSLNTLKGDLTLAAGTGISISSNGTDTLTIASTSSGDVTLTAFGSSPNANGASLTGQALTLQPADNTHPGGVSTTTQTFAGAKTFSSLVTMPTASIIGDHAVAGIEFNLNSPIPSAEVDFWGGGVQTFTMGYDNALARGLLYDRVHSQGIFFNSNSSISLGTDTSAAGAMNIFSVDTANNLVIIRNSAQLEFDCSVSGNVKLAAPATISVPYTLVWPNAQGGVSSILTNDGSGNLTWGPAIAALTDLTDAGTDGITITNGTGAVVGSSPVTISQHVADSTHNGYLSSTDWSTFNNKQSTVSFSAFGSTPNSNGGSISGGAITLQPADATNPGGVSIIAQSFAGSKTLLDITNFGNTLLPTVNNTVNFGSDSLQFGIIKGRRFSPSGTSTVTTGDTHTSTTIDNIPSTAGLLAGMDVFGSGIPDFTTITSVVNSTTISISSAATATASGVSLVFDFPGSYRTEDQTGTTFSGTVFYRSGNATNGRTGNWLGRTGAINAGGTGFSGNWLAGSGAHPSGNSNTTGATTLVSGNNSGSGATGVFTAGSGNSTSGDSGAVNIKTGTGVNSGDLNIFTGTASGTRGSVFIAGAALFLNAPTTATSLVALNLTASQAVVTDGSKQLTSLAYTTAATATTLAERDSSANLSANSMISSYRTQATANSTLTLVVGDAQQQYFTGSTSGQIVQMPVTSTLVTGQSWIITNNSTVIVTVNSSGSNQIIQIAANSTAIITCISTSGTTAASWSATTVGAGGANYPTISTVGASSHTGSFPASSTGTYTTPANCIAIKVRLVGGGGGGGSSNDGSGSNGGTGGTTTFGSSLLTATGGSGGGNGTGAGAGGSFTLNSPATGSGFAGGEGGAGSLFTATNNFNAGGTGGNSAFGGGGSGNLGTGGDGKANTGGGGGGAGNNSGSSNKYTAGGGGAGGFIDALITSPSATYSYAVGASGSAGSGAGQSLGGVGGSGYIEVTEYYANGAIGTATTITGTISSSNVTTATFVAPTVQRFTTGTAQTYTTPTSPRSPLYIKVQMVGGGGGGGPSGTGGGSAGNNGAASTFGSQLSAGGGNGGGGVSTTDGANGGTSSLGSGPIGVALPGGSGGGGGNTPAFDLNKQLTALGLKVPTNMKEWSSVYSSVTKSNNLSPVDQTKLLAELGIFSKTLEGK